MSPNNTLEFYQRKMFTFSTTKSKITFIFEEMNIHLAVEYLVGNFYVVLHLKKLEKRHVLEEAMSFRNQWKESIKHAL